MNTNTNVLNITNQHEIVQVEIKFFRPMTTLALLSHQIFLFMVLSNATKLIKTNVFSCHTHRQKLSMCDFFIVTFDDAYSYYYHFLFFSFLLLVAIENTYTISSFQQVIMYQNLTIIKYVQLGLYQ